MAVLNHTQECSRCREVKPLDDFHRSKGRPNDRHPQCKDCRSDLGKAERRARDTQFAERVKLLEVGQQRCVTCQEIKPLDYFYKSSRNKSGRKGQCINCYTEIGDEYRSRPEVRELIAQRRQKFNRENPEEAYRRQRKYGFKQKYGIDLEDYDAMLAGQDGRCAICFALPSPDAPLYVDHCHSTGAVRGLLCHPCNAGIGFLGDDPNRMTSAIRYLESNAAQQPLMPKLK